MSGRRHDTASPQGSDEDHRGGGRWGDRPRMLFIHDNRMKWTAQPERAQWVPPKTVLAGRWGLQRLRGQANDWQTWARQGDNVGSEQKLSGGSRRNARSRFQCVSV
jgi:hypothetical protein